MRGAFIGPRVVKAPVVQPQGNARFDFYPAMDWRRICPCSTVDVGMQSPFACFGLLFPHRASPKMRHHVLFAGTLSFRIHSAALSYRFQGARSRPGISMGTESPISSWAA